MQSQPTCTSLAKLLGNSRLFGCETCSASCPPWASESFQGISKLLRVSMCDPLPCLSSLSAHESFWEYFLPTPHPSKKIVSSLNRYRHPTRDNHERSSSAPLSALFVGRFPYIIAQPVERQGSSFIPRLLVKLVRGATPNACSSFSPTSTCKDAYLET